MKTFIIKLVFEVTVGGEHQHFDEQMRVFTSLSSEEALNEAADIGDAEAQQFVNRAGDMIEWKFSGITDIIEISGKSNGSLLYSQSKHNEDVREYNLFVGSKSIAIKRGVPTFV
jgi:hypothetical protein